MKKLIIREGKYRTNYLVADYISKNIDADIKTIKECDAYLINEYHDVILIFSVYFSKPTSTAKKFIQKYEQLLIRKNIQLVFCSENDDPDNYLPKLFGQELVKKAETIVWAGSALNVGTISFTDKIICRVFGKYKSYDDIKFQELEKIK
ncbi:MAG: flavodoxin domain-containing protein [Mycoplasmatales bacterium]